MNENLILLDPFRSALICQAVHEKVITFNFENRYAFHETITHKIGADQVLREQVMQLLLLYPTNKIIQDEEDGHPALAQEPAMMRLAPLQALGLITFTNPIDPERTKRWSTARLLDDLWMLEKDFIEQYDEIIAMELAKKGILTLEQFAMIKSMRFNQKVTGNETPWNPELELLIFTRVNELRAVELEKLSSPSDVGHFRIEQNDVQEVNHADQLDRTSRVYQIIVDELATGKIHFPMPASLIELMKLKNDPQVNEFRKIFKDWMTRLTKLDLAEEQKLRKELARFRFKSSAQGKLKVFGQVMTYASIPMSLVPGPLIGMGLTLVQIGMDRLASRWARDSAWLSFGSQ
ncbi:MAG: hypothetical protein KF763_15220 [Cyclobacteriaceae bacterium]|nr:hypothetical protein [Cyclobacteriaceae bacterium]